MDQKRPYRYQYSYTRERQGRYTQPGRPQQAPKRKRGKGKFIAIALALLLVVGGAWFMVKPSNNPVKSLAKNVTKKVENKPEPPKPVLDQNLQSQIAAWAAKSEGDYGVAVREINGTMRYASYQADKLFTTASTFKPFVAYVILHKIEQGDLTMNSTTYKGNTISYCMQRMIHISDNECAYQLERLAGFAATDTFLHEQGYPNTNLNNYTASGQLTSADKKSTATDEARLMWNLYAGRLLNKADTDYLIDLMKNQQWRERIPAGVPAGIAVADKPGWITGIEADTGIVYGTKSTYVITIMSSGTNPSDLADLSRLVYDHLNNVTTTVEPSRTSTTYP